MNKELQSQGWIKLHRQMLDNPICRNPELSWLFVVLLLKANYKDREFYFNNQKILVKRGQLITGRKELAKEVGISESKVQRFLTLLQNEQLIEQLTTSRYRLLTVINYDWYHKDEQQNEQQMNNKRTTDEQQMNTNKKDKKDKKVKKEKKYNIIICKFKKPTIEDIINYCNERGNTVDAEKFYNYYESNGWKVGKNPMKDWKAAIRTWERNGFDNKPKRGRMSIDII